MEDKQTQNWRKARKFLMVFYVLITCYAAWSGYQEQSLVVFFAAFFSFSYLSYYLLSRINIAEKQEWETPKKPSQLELNKLGIKFMGGGKKITAAVFICSTIAIGTVVIGNAF